MTFTPDRSMITNITNANPAVVTTSPAHGMQTGNVARLNVPLNYGMFQINNVVVSITRLSSTTFSCQLTQVPPAVNLNTVDYPAFVTPTNPGFEASVIPIGAGPTPVISVDWQSRNNFCESKIDDALTNTSTVEIPF